MSDPMKSVRKLKRQFADADEGSQAQISEWERELKKAIITARLGENDAFKILLGQLRQNIVGVNAKLMYDRTLTERQRDALFERRDVWEQMIGYFTEADAKIETISKNIQDNLE